MSEELRECYSEAKVASLIHHRGGSVRELSEFVRYSSPRSFTGAATSQRFTPDAMNHPVKIDIGRHAGD